MKSKTDPPAADVQSTRSNLERECAVIHWHELARHFARGVVLKVDESLDLISVGVSFADDATDVVQGWLEKGLVTKASDDDARAWSSAQTEFNCIVAAPWVLVQVQPGSSSLH